VPVPTLEVKIKPSSFAWLIATSLLSIVLLAGSGCAYKLD